MLLSLCDSRWQTLRSVIGRNERMRRSSSSLSCERGSSLVDRARLVGRPSLSPLKDLFAILNSVVNVEPAIVDVVVIISPGLGHVYGQLTTRRRVELHVEPQPNSQRPPCHIPSRVAHQKDYNCHHPLSKCVPITLKRVNNTSVNLPKSTNPSKTRHVSPSRNFHHCLSFRIQSLRQHAITWNRG